MSNRNIIIAGVLLLVILLGVFLLLLSLSGNKGPSRKELQEASKPVTLTYWRAFDGDDAVRDIISAYTATHPNVSIQVRKLRFEEYESALVNAFAEDRGPDLFSIHNTWVDRYLPKLAYMPSEMKLAFFKESGGGFQKKVQVTIDTVAGLSLRELQEQFLDIVVSDVVREVDKAPRIVGLPYFVDVLALFYNKDLFNNAGLGSPPGDWKEFASMVAGGRLTVKDENGAIRTSGAAFGGSRNVQRAPDLLATLMMQNGAEMTRQGLLSFDHTPSYLPNQDINPAVNSLMFYTDFASPVNELYTWDEKMPDSFEAFTQGITAMFFGYSYHADQLRTLNPRIRYGIVPIPQLNAELQAVTGNYWIETVSKKSTHQDYAWDFLRFATSKENVTKYLTATKKPTALRALIEEQKKDELLYPFASQLLIAKNWFHGKNPDVMEDAFYDMIAEALLTKGGTRSEEQEAFGPIIQKAKQIIQEGY